MTFTGDLSFRKVLGIENKKRPHLNRNFIINFRQRFIFGKIWTDSLGVPGQEGYNIEGNSSNDMLRKNYLVDNFYGHNNLFSHYHLPGEGNIRGFVGRKERGAEALIALSNEFGIIKNLANEDQDPLNIELVSFVDMGIFWDRQSNIDGLRKNNFHSRTLADAGIGVHLNTKFLEKDLYFRFDIPFYLYDGSNTVVDWNNWIFSFQKSL
tara:strand:- start:45 stop:671 length:627 start_codon:yes stop_codon:yes gene_type:complete